MRGSATIRLLLAAAVALASFAGAPAARARPSLVLVTLDTVRSDYLGCYGARSARTPAIDGLASAGTRYARAISASPLTLPAHSSLMTGLDPPEHGMRDNGFGVLPAGVPTLAEALSAEGYRTAAFVASRVLDSRFGLARGFDHYDDRMAAERLGEYGYPERDAAEVTSAATAWLGEALRRTPDRPYFVWVHYYDAHAPYAPPAPWRGEEPATNYAGEIAYVDGELGRLLASLPARAERRVVALAGDHGEALGEHEERGHGIFLYRASLEVPLILEGAGVPKGGVVDEVVPAHALAPTLLRLLGLPDAASRFGEPLPGLPVSGAARAPALVYSETLLPATAYGWSPLKAVSEGRWRLILAPRPELYDFISDPGERTDQIAGRPEVAARLEQSLEARERSSRPRAAAPAPRDPELAASLHSLGYLSGSSAAQDRAATGGIDPKDGVAMLVELEEAKQHLAGGRTEAALRKLEDLVRRSPGNVPFLSQLARAQLASGRSDEAVATHRRALERNPDSEFLHLNLAQACLELGRSAEARREYEAALRLSPRLARAWLGLAEIAMKEGSGAEERRILDQAVDAGTESAAVFARRAQLARAAEDLEAADRDLRRATGLAPGWAPAWLIWGDLAESRGLVGDAIERYGRAGRAEPPSVLALLRAGRLLIRERRVEEGRRLLERVAAIAPDSAEGQEARRRLAGLDEGR